MFFNTTKEKFHHLAYFDMLSANVFNLDWSQILLFGKELKLKKLC